MIKKELNKYVTKNYNFNENNNEIMIKASMGIGKSYNNIMLQEKNKKCKKTNNDIVNNSVIDDNKTYLKQDVNINMNQK